MVLRKDYEKLKSPDIVGPGHSLLATVSSGSDGKTFTRRGLKSAYYILLSNSFCVCFDRTAIVSIIHVWFDADNLIEVYMSNYGVGTSYESDFYRLRYVHLCENCMVFCCQPIFVYVDQLVQYTQ